MRSAGLAAGASVGGASKGTSVARMQLFQICIVVRDSSVIIELFYIAHTQL